VGFRGQTGSVGEITFCARSPQYDALHRYTMPIYCVENSISDRLRDWNFTETSLS